MKSLCLSILLGMAAAKCSAEVTIKEKRLTSSAEPQEFRQPSSQQNNSHGLDTRSGMQSFSIPKYGKDIVAQNAEDSPIAGLASGEGFTGVRWVGNVAIGSAGLADRHAAWATENGVTRFARRSDWTSSIVRDLKSGPRSFVATGDFLGPDRYRGFVFWHGAFVWTFAEQKYPVDIRGKAVVSLNTSTSSNVVVAADRGNSDSSTIIFAFDLTSQELAPASALKCQHENNSRNIINFGIRAELPSGPAALFVGSSGGGAWILAVKPDGDCFYSKVLDTNRISVELRAIANLSDGYLVAGDAKVPAGVSNIYIARLDKNLKQRWARVCGSKKGVALMNITVAEDNIFVMGAGSGIVWGSSPWLLNVSPDGYVLADGFGNAAGGEVMYLAGKYDGTQMVTIGSDGRSVRRRVIGYKDVPATLNFPESLISTSSIGGDAKLFTKRALTCLDALVKPGSSASSAVRDKRF